MDSEDAGWSGADTSMVSCGLSLLLGHALLQTVSPGTLAFLPLKKVQHLQIPFQPGQRISIKKKLRMTWLPNKIL